MQGNNVKNIQDTIRRGVLLSERGWRAVLHYRCWRAYRFNCSFIKKMDVFLFWNSPLTGLLGHYFFQHKNVASYSSCWHHQWKGNLCSKKSKSMWQPTCTLELFKPRWMVFLIAKVLNHQPNAFSASNTIHAHSDSFFSQIIEYIYYIMY